MSDVQQEKISAMPDDSFRVGSHLLTSRLILGTGKYDSFEQMQQSHEAAETHCVTVAVRREKLHDSAGRNILDFLDPETLVVCTWDGSVWRVWGLIEGDQLVVRTNSEGPQSK